MVCCSLWQTGIEAVQPFSRLCAAPPASAVCMHAVATQQHLALRLPLQTALLPLFACLRLRRCTGTRWSLASCVRRGACAHLARAF